MSVRSTSKLAYAEVNADGTALKLRHRVYMEILKHPSTIREIATALDRGPNSISGRVNELYNKYDLIDENRKRRCKVSHKMAIEWIAKTQPSLFNGKG